VPRNLRIELDGAVYHVMGRGDRREPIVRDDRDRQRFLETLSAACTKTDWQVHALCLMPKSLPPRGRDTKAKPRRRDQAVSGH